MPYVFNDPNYQRTMEVLYRGPEYTGTPLAAALDIAATPILPGMVAVILNNEVAIADSTVDNGSFKGLFLSQANAALDELNAKDLAPVIVTGPATVKVLNAALDPGATFTLSASEVVQLVVGTGAAAGRLTPRAAQTGPAVAHLQKVLSDGIEIALLPEATDE